MTPSVLLIVLVAITCGAACIQAVRTARRRAELSRLAKQWDMHYCPNDRFQLARRIAPRLPIIGAADVRVSDLIYGKEAGYYRFIFNVQYTTGVVRWKKRALRIATCRDVPGPVNTRDWSDLQFAPEELEILEQYRALRNAASKNTSGGIAAPA